MNQFRSVYNRICGANDKTDAGETQYAMETWILADTLNQNHLQHKQLIVTEQNMYNSILGKNVKNVPK